MPVYEYICDKGHTFEKLVAAHLRDEFGALICSVCGSPVKGRKMSSFTAVAKWPGRTSGKATGGADDFIPRNPTEWHQAVGRNHGRT
jgi:predicted nucleic acid-binding Zn ribbon protein